MWQWAKETVRKLNLFLNSYLFKISSQISCKGTQCNAGLSMEIWAECNLSPCMDWRVGNWSQCSEPCGGGTMVNNFL